MLNSFIKWAEKPVSSESLGIFRILFGLITLWEVFYLYEKNFLDDFIFGPNFLFNYDFLPVSPLSPNVMDMLLAGLGISCVLITLGLFYRIAISYFFVVFSYFFLLDKGLYNNHLYLISLIAFLMIWVNANASFSIFNKDKSKFIPQWQIRILQFQIGAAFFFGGIAKINPYWISFHPVQEILLAKADASGFAFLNESFFHYLIMLGGLMFDILIPFLLLNKKTRLYAIGAAIVFNLTNSWIFNDINIFPYFMITALVLFLDEKETSRLPFTKPLNAIPTKVQFKMSKLVVISLGVYILFQVLFPLRHFMYPGYVDWTGDGQRFAWRMKIQHRRIDELKFAIFDLDKKEIHQIDPKNHINYSQYQQLALYPRMAVQFAEFLKELAYKNGGIKNVEVKCKIKVSFNGSNPTYIFDPNLDLLQSYEEHKYFNEWIEPTPLLNNN